MQWSGVERVVAFADVHGAYAELVTLLRETGIPRGTRLAHAFSSLDFEAAARAPA